MKKIRIVSPAKAIEKKHIDYAVSFLEKKGFTVSLGKYCTHQFHYFAGTDEERLQDLQNALNDKDIDVILCARGGYGSIRIVDALDFSTFVQQPKMLIGFSDITVFHNHIHAHFNLPTVHASMPLNFENNTPESLNSLVNVISKQSNIYEFDSHPKNRNKDVKGIIVGGNLSILYALIGTNSDMDTNRKILFIEDVGEFIYGIDRILWAFKKANKWQGLKALVVGGMTDIKDTETPFGQSIEDIILESVKEYDFPVFFNFPAGHINDNRAIIFGKEAEIFIKNNKIVFRN